MAVQTQDKSSYNVKMLIAQLINSSVSNILGGAVGHPLDTVRVNFFKSNNSI